MSHVPLVGHIILNFYSLMLGSLFDPNTQDLPQTRRANIEQWPWRVFFSATNLSAVTTIEIEADEADFLNKKKIYPEFGSDNLDPAGSVFAFSILQVLRFSCWSLNLELP